MPEPETTTETAEESQESATDDLGEAGKKALAEERKARRALEKQLKEATDATTAAAKKAKELEDRDKSEAQKALDRIAELEKLLADKDFELSKKDQDILRRDIAKDKGVPVRFVTGSTREEMEDAAQEFLEFQKGGEKRPIGALRSGASAATNNDPKQRAAAALRGLNRG